MSIIKLEKADQFVIVDAEMTTAELQQKLGSDDLMLGVLHDPASTMSLSDLFMNQQLNLWQGAFGYLRDQVLGANWTLADGKNINTGAQVVKSVAGYDLSRLLLGSGTLLARCNTFTLRLRPIRRKLFYYRISLEDYLGNSHRELLPSSAVADGAQHIIMSSHYELRRDYLSLLDSDSAEQNILDVLRKFNAAPATTALTSRPDVLPHPDFDWNSWQYPCSNEQPACSAHLDALRLALCPNGESFGD